MTFNQTECFVKISIIIPAYNVERYIGEALDSVFAQSVLPYEIIVVNDGSTDSTSSVAEQFIGQHPRYRIYTTVNQGLGPARNYGLDQATGDYVYFFDSDDILRKEFVCKISSIIMAKRPDVIFFSGRSFFDVGFSSDFSPNYNRNINEHFPSGEEAANALFSSRGLISSACLYVSRKEYLDRNGLRFKPITHEDEEFLIPFLFLANGVTVIDDELFLRRVRSGSIMTRDKSIKNLIGYKECILSLVEFKKDFPEKCRISEHVWRIKGQSLLLAMLSLNKQLKNKHFNAFFWKFSKHFWDAKFLARIVYLFSPEKGKEILKKLRGWIR